MLRIKILIILALSYAISGEIMPLLKLLKIRNPVILGTKTDISHIEMFNLMKSVMKHSQNIQISTLTGLDENKTLPLNFYKVPCIMFEEDFHILTKVKGQNIVKSPWVIMDSKNSKLHFHSRIDEPIYFWHNYTLSEQYKIKSLKIANILSSKSDEEEIKWKKGVKKNLFERRSNFGGITLFGMVQPDSTSILYTSEPQEETSSVIPNTYEVRIEHKGCSHAS